MEILIHSFLSRINCLSNSKSSRVSTRKRLPDQLTPARHAPVTLHLISFSHSHSMPPPSPASLHPSYIYIVQVSPQNSKLKVQIPNSLQERPSRKRARQGDGYAKNRANKKTRISAHLLFAFPFSPHPIFCFSFLSS